MRGKSRVKVHFVDIPTSGDALCGCNVGMQISWTCDPFDVTCPRCRKVLQERVSQACVGAPH